MFNYKCGTTLLDLFNHFNVKPKDRDFITRELFKEGYTVKGICYAATRAEEKLLYFSNDPRFVSIFINEVRKYALKPNDPRWGDKFKTNDKITQQKETTKL